MQRYCRTARYKAHLLQRHLYSLINLQRTHCSHLSRVSACVRNWYLFPFPLFHASLLSEEKKELPSLWIKSHFLIFSNLHSKSDTWATTAVSLENFGHMIFFFYADHSHVDHFILNRLPRICRVHISLFWGEWGAASDLPASLVHSSHVDGGARSSRRPTEVRQRVFCSFRVIGSSAWPEGGRDRSEEKTNSHIW